jgi:hypothetical protein
VAEAQLRLTPDGEEALREAQRLCFRANVAIVSAEHLLCGALAVLHGLGCDVPAPGLIAEALTISQGAGGTAHSHQLMFGSAARAAMDAVADRVARSGSAAIDAAAIARGTIESGELSPMVFAALRTTRDALLAALPAGTAWARDSR